MRVACLLVTHLRAKVEMYRHSHLKDAPVVIVDRSPSRATPVVVDCFRSAPGAKPGMTLEQAVSRHGKAIVLNADEPHYRRVFGQVLSSLQGISDRVEEADLGTAYVRLDGLEGRFRGEAGVVSALLNTVPAYLNPRSASRTPSSPRSSRPGRAGNTERSGFLKTWRPSSHPIASTCCLSPPA